MKSNLSLKDDPQDLESCRRFLEARGVKYSLTPCGKRIQFEHSGGLVDYFIDGGFWMSRVTAKKGNGLESLLGLVDPSFINEKKESSQ